MDHGSAFLTRLLRWATLSFLAVHFLVKDTDMEQILKIYSTFLADRWVRQGLVDSSPYDYDVTPKNLSDISGSFLGDTLLHSSDGTTWKCRQLVVASCWLTRELMTLDLTIRRHTQNLLLAPLYMHRTRGPSSPRFTWDYCVETHSLFIDECSNKNTCVDPVHWLCYNEYCHTKWYRFIRFDLNTALRFPT